MGQSLPFTIGEPDHLTRIHMKLALQDSGFAVAEEDEALVISGWPIGEHDWRAVLRQRSGSGLVDGQRNAGDRLHHHGTADRPLPSDIAAFREPHDADPVALVRAQDMIADLVFTYVNSDVPAACALEHQHGTRCELRSR
jgi:hypothetical protein